MTWLVKGRTSPPFPGAPVGLMCAHIMSIHGGWSGGSRAWRHLASGLLQGPTGQIGGQSVPFGGSLGCKDDWSRDQTELNLYLTRQENACLFRRLRSLISKQTYWYTLALLRLCTRYRPLQGMGGCLGYYRLPGYRCQVGLRLVQY